MDTKEIHDRLIGMEKTLSDMGYITPEAHFSANYLSEKFSCWLEYRTDKFASNETVFFHSEHAEQALAMADLHIRDMPTVEDKRKADFLKALGRVIDQGRAADVDVDFLNPLTETMKRLSENVITHKPLRAVGDDFPF